MNATLQAQNAYGQRSQPIRTDRDTEYDAFARITSRMKAAAAQGASGYRELAEALYDNRRLWTILVTDIANTENHLPPELKARIAYLADFTRAQSTKILKREAKPDSLIEINSAVMKGLRRSSFAQPPSKVSPTP